MACAVSHCRYALFKISSKSRLAVKEKLNSIAPEKPGSHVIRLLARPWSQDGRTVMAHEDDKIACRAALQMTITTMAVTTTRAATPSLAS